VARLLAYKPHSLDTGDTTVRTIDRPSCPWPIPTSVWVSPVVHGLPEPPKIGVAAPNPSIVWNDEPVLTVMSGVAADSGGAVRRLAAVTNAVAAATNAIWDLFTVYSTSSCGVHPRGSWGVASGWPSTTCRAGRRQPGSQRSPGQPALFALTGWLARYRSLSLSVEAADEGVDARAAGSLSSGRGWTRSPRALPEPRRLHHRSPGTRLRNFIETSKTLNLMVKDACGPSRFLPAATRS
jgi:hypothetical protein